ncbi:hypothetical protein Tco_0576860 [Tanacetum coccineum]
MEIKDNEDVKFFVNCSSNSNDGIPHLYVGERKKTGARILPGPAGILQKALLRKNADVMKGGHDTVMPTQEYVRKVIDDVSKDDHFISSLWLREVVYLHGEGVFALELAIFEPTDNQLQL